MISDAPERVGGRSRRGGLRSAPPWPLLKTDKARRAPCLLTGIVTPEGRRQRLHGKAIERRAATGRGQPQETLLLPGMVTLARRNHVLEKPRDFHAPAFEMLRRAHREARKGAVIIVQLNR
jgi:hypothetical protein